MTATDWRPTATIATLERRADMLAAVRRFFAERGVLEVETPVLARHTVTDPAIDSFEVNVGRETWYLQTSPEFHMKRLLAAGAPAIVRIGPVFRREEQGRLHNPEFTMLEWYRPGMSSAELRREVAALVDLLLGAAPHSEVTYRELMVHCFGVDPLRAAAAELGAVARTAGLHLSPPTLADRGALLDVLFAHALSSREGRTFVDEFPADQAALARTRRSEDGVAVADRFELVIDGMEIANGYVELTDPTELARRMAADAALRRASSRDAPPPDRRLLDAMSAGLPACSGVALGFDRLVLLALGAGSLDEVMAFPASRA